VEIGREGCSCLPMDTLCAYKVVRGDSLVVLGCLPASALKQMIRETHTSIESTALMD